MLTKLRTLASLYRQAGFRWSAFRVAYALRFRTGLIRLQMPQYKWTERPLETWLQKDVPSAPKAYTQWRKQNSPRFFNPHPERSGERLSRHVVEGQWNPQTALEEANRIIAGEIKYFAHEYQKVGFPPNWHQSPVSGFEFSANKHWSQISDDGEVDIKFIWEVNRFGFVYTLVRAYASTKDEKYAQAFWKSILDWAEHNPPNTGPNWMDGQEISLRLMAWTFGFYAFIDSASTRAEYIAQFVTMVAAQAERIHQNIAYAISTQSNHTISEACGLWLVGMLFPELADSEKYLSLGRKLLEEEAIKQIFPDGSYSMYSLNYHRCVLQIYFYAMQLGELNDSPFSESVKRVVTKSVDYLYQLIDPETGQMPVYGSNDGALVLPLNNCDFTDYRPLLQLGSFVTRGKKLFKSGPWDEDLYWICGSQALDADVDIPKQTNQGFSSGGVYVTRGLQSKAVIRCTDFQSRPSHADQLHVDLWWQGNNIVCDAGTYLYSGEGPWRNGLAHSSVHNTVTVDSEDQMKLVSRFTWTDWAQGKILQRSEKLWQGEDKGYMRLSDPVSHVRTVLMLENDRWLVIDQLSGTEPHRLRLHWLVNDYLYEQKDNSLLLDLKPEKYQIRVGALQGKPAFSVVRADPANTRGWRSRYYGHKEPAVSIAWETNQQQACLWTFFGFESDLVEEEGSSLKITSMGTTSSIDLNSPRLA